LELVEGDDRILSVVDRLRRPMKRGGLSGQSVDAGRVDVSVVLGSVKRLQTVDRGIERCGAAGQERLASGAFTRAS
jgi:hypothetical protein